MFVKKEYKNSPIIPILIFIIIFYIILRISSEAIVAGDVSPEILMKASDDLFNFKAIVFTQQSLTYSALGSVFAVLIYYNVQMQNKRNVEGSTYGTAEWAKPSDLNKYKDKKLEDNIILTKTEQISRNMRKSEHNRNIVLLGRPGTGKSRYFFKPNLLNVTGTIVVTDPKGELLRDCGYSLKKRGYTIKVLNLDEKYKSNRYNPLKYIKTVPIEAIEALPPELREARRKTPIAEDDVMSLIDVIFKNTKSDNIESTSGDPFWEKAEMIYLQALIYYVLFNMDEDEKNFASVLKLIRLSEPDPQTGQSELDRYFDEWTLRDPQNIGVKQWKHFKVAATSPKMMSTIIMTATARLAPLNIREVEDLISTDDFELDRIGKDGEEGKIAYFIITKPGDSAFNFIANILYSQIFKMVDYNASTLYHGSLATSCDLYMDEWAQLGEIPRFVEQLAYVRGLNCGIVIGLQSLSQLKKVYKDSWETALDCCDYVLFMGSQSKETLEYISQLMGKKTWYKKNSSQQFGAHGHTSRTWDEVGRELATVDELSRLKKGYCVLSISGMQRFYSEMYDLKKHPRYKELYEPWNKNDPENAKREYNHLPEVQAYRKRMQNIQKLKEAGISCDLSRYITAIKN